MVPHADTPDREAVRILLGAKGYRGRPPMPEARRHAVAAGLMFEPNLLFGTTHDEVVERLVVVRSSVDPGDAADAFVASLGSRRLELRPTVASRALAEVFPRHELREAFSDPPAAVDMCEICGLLREFTDDLDWHSYAAFKWGGVGLGSPSFMAFDLEQFSNRPRLKASSRDWAILAEMLERIETGASRDSSMPVGGVPELLKGLLPSNGVERRVLVETLGWLGILHPAGDPRWIDGWIDPSVQRPPPTGRNDWPFPLHSWRGADGVDRDAVGRFFPQV